MLRKILFSIIFIVFIKILMYLFIDLKNSKLSENELETIRVETNNLNQNDKEKMALEASKINKMMSQKELETLVSIMSKNYPKTSTDGIRIDRISAGIGLITYHKTTVNNSIEEFDLNELNSYSHFQKYLKEICSNVGLRNFLKWGVAVKNIYSDKNAKKINEITIQPHACKNI